MIDPVHSLAFSIQANRGVYAVLVGSGLSRAARIPTGWEITLDLLRKLAELHEENADPDPEEWYRTRFKQEANYSTLLDSLTKTPEERQQLLRGYMEPNQSEREDGDKQPTAAHRAIAALAARGYIRVILTTNFDRLLETALADEGVMPTVLSSSDQIQGALPLIHTQCCVVKLHGDYLDTRIRNTPAELEKYPPELDELLDRILDEFGLVVCGWSAKWDGALCSALLRSRSRRFTTYWALRSEPGNEARRLMQHRRAEQVKIDNADSFFEELSQCVQSIEQYSKPHPLSVEAAVVSLKRYMSEPKFRIQFSDLIHETVEQVVEATSGSDFDADGVPRPTSETITSRVRSYEGVCSMLLSLAVVGGAWAEEQHYSVWQRAIERLATKGFHKGYVSWLELQRYRATLLLYALGIAAVDANRLHFLKSLFYVRILEEIDDDIAVVQALPPQFLFVHGFNEMKKLEGMERHHLPLNDWLHQALRPFAKRVIGDDARYDHAFDKFEMLMALNCLAQGTRLGPRAPLGRFVFRDRSASRVRGEIEDSISNQGAESPFVKFEICGDTVEACKRNLQTLYDFARSIRWR